MMEHNLTIPAKDGYLLTAIEFVPESPPRGFIQFNSGTGIPKEFYANFCRFLVDNGYITLIYDYRGIGDSAPEKLKGFEATATDWGFLDASGVFDWALANYPHEKKIVMGHSMGGQLVGFIEEGKEIDQVVMITAGTGYWKNMPSSTLKTFLPLIWNLYIPMSVALNGFAHARKIRQGENLPKGVALQWRKWCLHPKYWEVDFGDLIDRNIFERIKAPITSFIVQDDHIVSELACRHLLQYYMNSSIEYRYLDPKDCQNEPIGHFGLFSRKHKEDMWLDVLEVLE